MSAVGQDHGRDQRSAAHDLLRTLAATLRTPSAEGASDAGAHGAGGAGSAAGGVVLRHEASGRPVVDGLSVSLSHARGLVAVAASFAGPIGVDVESRREFEIDGMARRWFDPAEVTWLHQQPDPLDAFLRLWTAKEAVGKALGRGLRGSGLRRRMPLDPGPAALRPEIAHLMPSGVVPVEPDLVVLQLPVRAEAVLAVAVPVGVSEVWVTEHHGAALRSTVTSRTSFPVVVRGN
ncbi:4'-phosphopantetheinyl transferase superfamily protein [Kribbella qitaiheensis]|uniref:4'-phosphopantetheinyl transferase superfamily protein n=1 Tax=Kribbella qitaiheensis TaxID=1544730 RepID=A0A7G6X9M7_9ACTN|nr:4'-phosphopantetheinyl transferase superfamily protein [Kribbella qitaiheensis]